MTHSSGAGAGHASDRLHQFGKFDPVTGLANRALFEERLVRALSRSDRSGRMVGVMLVDLDGRGGDQLRHLGERLSRSLRPGDTVARIGECSLGIVLAGIRDVDSLEVVAKTIQHALWIGAESPPVYMGAALYPLDADRPVELAARADQALQRAVEDGRSSFRMYDSNIGRNRPTLARDAIGALHRREIELLFRPVLDLRRSSISGVEAHLQWRHPSLGLLGPGRLVPLLEGAAVFDEIADWLITSVCRFHESWHQRGLDDFFASINLPASQLCRVELPDFVSEVIEEVGINPSSLVLEVNEGVVGDDGRAEETLEAFKAAGLRISLDGFGAGTSSLQTLKQLPLDILKLDGELVSSSVVDRTGAALARGIIALGHSLGLVVVGEDVETSEQLSFLRTCGCDAVHGPLVGPALPGEEFERWIWASSFAPVA